MDIKDLLSNLTVEEKAALVSGTDFMFTNPVPRLNIKSIETSDGPHGLRKQEKGGDNGINESLPATAFPTAATTACGWNEENLYKMGEAIARESLSLGVSVVLGPGANIKRSPLGGRNFEYFSEDSYLSGKLAAAEVKGIQSLGVSACVKHFALNNAENFRFFGNSVCDMRAMREIYLKSFERIIKEAKPHSVMCAYNRINGVFCCENEWLLNGVLRGEWGFDGLVMSDWGATHDRVAGVVAGLDLEMPGDTPYCRKSIIDAVKKGTLSEEKLEEAVENVLRLVEKSEGRRGEADLSLHDKLSAEIAADCAVLLKNQGVLPLKRDEKILAVGELFEKMRYQGAGSSMINPAFLTSPKTAFDMDKIDYLYACGYRENTAETDESLILQAEVLAEDCDKILIFAGLTDEFESEGADRENLNLPKNQLDLIDAMIKTGKKTVVVLFGGSPVELPFAEKADGILHMLLPGQNGGTALKQLLYGEKNPSGRLAETYVKSYSDAPFASEFSSGLNEVYKESIFVGYRYFLTAEKEVLYPFGYGLSYTKFDYSDFFIAEKDGKITASVTLKNSGNYDGAEVVQLYSSMKDSAVFRAKRELRAFKKVYLKKGEEKKVELAFDTEDLKFFDIGKDRFALEDGEYTFEICRNCQKVELFKTLKIDGERVENPYPEEVSKVYSRADMQGVTDEIYCKMSRLELPEAPPVKPITVESRFTDLKKTFFGRILFCAVLSVAKRQLKRAKRLPKGVERENAVKGAVFLKRILESGCLRSMSMSAGRRMPYNFALGMKELANGHIIRAIKYFVKKIKVPPLPKDEK